MLKIQSTILFVIIVIAAIASEWDTLIENIGTLGPSVIMLNVLMLGIGYQSAKFFNIETAKATTVSIESGIQNATVGITIGGLIYTYPLFKSSRIKNTCVNASLEYVTPKVPYELQSNRKAKLAWAVRFCNGGNISNNN